MASLRNSLVGVVPALRAFAVSLCGDPTRADDLVQETLVKAWAHQDSFQEGTNLRAWLFTILRNTYFSDCRKRQREVEDGDGSLTATLAVPPAKQGVVDMIDLQDALARLPVDQREAIILIGGAGCSYEEAAEICGCAIGTIKSRVNRARNRLALDLGVTGAEDYGPDPSSDAIVSRAYSMHR
jgi:RNA polymerase sigma-70 factor, ECF subfamily